MYCLSNQDLPTLNKVLLSINSRSTSYGTKLFSLCCYTPRQWAPLLIKYIEQISTYPLHNKDKNKSLVPLFINNVCRQRAEELMNNIKAVLTACEIPFKEHEGRHKDEQTGEASQHGSSLDMPLVGLLGNIRPWHIPVTDVYAKNQDIQFHFDPGPKVGDISEQRILAALKSISCKDVDILLSNKGSWLDMKGIDLIIVYLNKVWGFQIKSTALDAVLYQEKYSNNLTIWVDPQAPQEELNKLAQEIKEASWDNYKPVEKPQLKKQVINIATQRPQALPLAHAK